MDNLLEYRDGHELLSNSADWSSRLTAGSGRSYGIDLQVERNYGRFTGFLGYGLLWSDRLFPELNRGVRFPSKFDNRHKLNISLNYKVSKKVEINAGWTYMTGNRATIAIENYSYVDGHPTTIVPSYPNKDEVMLNYYSGRNNVRLPAYHRLDLGLNIYQPHKNGRMGIWNVSVYNAYSRMNPIMIVKKDDKATQDGKPLPPRFQKLSLFPIIPSVSYTYKF